MRIHAPFMIACVAAVTASCARTVAVESAGDVGSVIPANANSLPLGTTMEVRLDQSLGAKNQVGDRFTAHVTQAIIAQNGATVVPANAVVTGSVTGTQRSSDPTKPSLVRLDFDRLNFDGASYPFDASVQSTSTPNSNNDLLQKAAIGAAAGAVLGGVLSGGHAKDIIVGGAIGAAAGSLISLGMSSDAKLPEGTRMTLQTTRTIVLR